MVDHLDEDLLKTFQSEVFKLFKTAISFDEEFGCFVRIGEGDASALRNRRPTHVHPPKKQPEPWESKTIKGIVFDRQLPDFGNEHFRQRIVLT